MTRYVVLLRGVNVGGHNRLPMAELRAGLEGAGFADVATYIQSGNVALNGPSCDADRISDLIARDFDLDIRVVVRTAAELQRTVADNPFPDLEAEPTRLLVYFSGSEIPADWDRDLDYDKYPGDRAHAGPGEIYVGYRESLSSSKLNNQVLDRAIGHPTTARNWKTVLKLAEMAAT